MSPPHAGLQGPPVAARTRAVEALGADVYRRRFLSAGSTSVTSSSASEAAK